ncbi:MAG: hypothetical protein ACKO85_02045 [Isosphaeraceae bacterium]
MVKKSHGLRIAVAAGFLSIFAGSSQAQYGGWGGWGGWGASTPMQGIGYGMGAMAMGAGQYNLDSSMARSMNVDTNLRISQAMWQQQHYLNYTNILRRERTAQKTVKSIEGVKKRLHENPNTGDIRSGEALNAVLEDVTDPKKVHPSQMRLSRIALDPGMVKQLPLFYASEAIAFTLSGLVGEAEVPFLFKSKTYEKEIADLIGAIKNTERVDLEGNLTPDDIKAVDKAIAALEAKFQDSAKIDDAGYKEAKAALSAVKKLTKMLSKPNFEEILQTLDQAKKNNVEPTVTDLIGFMKHFNLRFGAAKTEKQAQALADLYPKMDQIRDEVLQQSKDASPEQIAVSSKNLAEVLDKLNTDDKTPPPNDGAGKK